MGTKLTVTLANGQKDELQDAVHSITDAGVLTIRVRKNGLEGTQVRTYSPPAWVSIETTEPFDNLGVNNLTVGGGGTFDGPIKFGR